ncbi:hypothetical protein BDV12DRAFT_174095 [Aspergillus spectabilis]
MYQLVKKKPRLIAILLAKYLDQKQKLFMSFDSLWSILSAMGKHLGEIYCIIDALDECAEESQESLLTQISETFGEHNGSINELGIHFLIKSRPYEEIARHL